MRVFVKGLNSCGMRKGDVQQYRDFLRANGHTLVEHPSQSEVVLLWTCAFRGDFRDSALQEIDRYQRDYDTELVVAGCLPDIDPAILRERFSGRVVNWRDDERKLREFFGAPKRQLSEIPRLVSDLRLHRDVTQFKQENPLAAAVFADQFVKLYIQEGCRFQCTYCAEILAFPPYRSFAPDDLVDACRREVEASGCLDVMLLV